MYVWWVVSNSWCCWGWGSGSRREHNRATNTQRLALLIDLDLNRTLPLSRTHVSFYLSINPSDLSHKPSLAPVSSLSIFALLSIKKATVIPSDSL